MRLLVFAYPIVLACAFLGATASARAHDGARWIMSDPRTQHCCGPEDCRQLADGEAAVEAGLWRVNGRPVPPGAVYPTGPEGGSRFWACFRHPRLVEPRCLFVPALF